MCKNNHTLAPHAFALHFSIHFRYTFQRHKQAPHTTQHTRQAVRLRSSEDSHLGQLYSVVDVTQQQALSLQDQIEAKLGQVKTRSKGVDCRSNAARQRNRSWCGAPRHRPKFRSPNCGRP